MVSSCFSVAFHRTVELQSWCMAREWKKLHFDAHSTLRFSWCAVRLQEAALDKQSPSLDDCLKLLKGERDEQRLAGLLLVTKFCKGDDLASLRRIYDAVGTQFLDRLLRTGNLGGTLFISVLSLAGSHSHDLAKRITFQLPVWPARWHVQVNISISRMVGNALRNAWVPSDLN